MRLAVIILFLSTLIGCKSQFESESDLLKWVADENNGHVKSRAYDDIDFAVKVLPAEYVAYTELKYEDYEQNLLDSILLQQENALVVLLQINIEKGTRDNAMFHGVQGMADYKKRIHQLNFQFSDFMSLNFDDKSCKPKVWTFEDTYNVGNKRTVYVVFSEPELQKQLQSTEEIDIKFNDEIFGTGISHFNFKADALESVPKINFWKHQVKS